MCPISGSGIMGQSRPFDWAKFTRCEGFWSRHASRKGLNFCMISAAAGYIHNEKRTLTSVYWKKKEDKGIEWSQDKMHPSEQMSMFSRRLVKSETYLFACCCCCFCANVQGDCTFFLQTYYPIRLQFDLLKISTPLSELRLSILFFFYFFTSK